MTIRSTNVAVRMIAAASLGLTALTFSSASVAQDGVSSILEGWQGTATLGGNISTGNSETSNINGSIRLGKTVNRWEHVVFGTVFKGQSSIVVTEEGEDGQPIRRIERGDNSNRIALGYQPKYFFSDKLFAFGILDWERDEPSNIDLGTRQIVGVGYRFFSNESGFLSGELGVGNKTTDVFFGDDISGGIGYLALNYLTRFNENTTFTADFRSDFGSDNTFVEFGLGLAFRVAQNLSLNISHFTRNNSDLTSSDSVMDSSSDSVTTFGLTFDI